MGDSKIGRALGLAEESNITVFIYTKEVGDKCSFIEHFQLFRLY